MLCFFFFRSSASEFSTDKEPKIAIILTEAGNDDAIIPELSAAEYPLTVAVLSRSYYAHDMCAELWSEGKETILQMPMETGREGVKLRHPLLLKFNMQASRIDQYLNEAIEEVSYEGVPLVSGVVNYYGGKFMRGQEEMEAVAKVLHEKKLYFVEIKTAKRSTAQAAMRFHHVPYAVHSVILDANPAPEAIRVQWRRLIQIALQKKRAIGIARLTNTTWTTLKTLLPTIEDQGVRLVYASEVVR